MSVRSPGNKEPMFSSISRAFESVDKNLRYHLLPPEEQILVDKQRRNRIRSEVALSRSGKWGPTHSADSDDDDGDQSSEPQTKDSGNQAGKVTCNGTDTTREETVSTRVGENLRSTSPERAGCAADYMELQSSGVIVLERMWNSAAAVVNDIIGTADQQRKDNKNVLECKDEESMDTEPIGFGSCSPCTGREKALGVVGYGDGHNDGTNGSTWFVEDRESTNNKCQSSADGETPITLGISPLERPTGPEHRSNYSSNNSVKSRRYQSHQKPSKKYNEANDLTNTKQGHNLTSASRQNVDAMPDSEEYDDKNARAAAAAVAAAAFMQNGHAAPPPTPMHANQVASTGGAHGFFKSRTGIQTAITQGALPSASVARKNRLPIAETFDDDEDAASAKRTFKDKVNNDSKQQSKNAKKDALPIPFETLSLDTDQMEGFQRSISELTMRSSYGEATAKLSDNRRMAYYAVGKNHNNLNGKEVQRGGNRRCYFTGKLIMGGRPFYAGSVQQGLRTLVVFCLPGAIGLPKLEILEQYKNENKGIISSHLLLSQVDSNSITENHTDWMENEAEALYEKMDADVLLEALPEPSTEVLNEMRLRYPDQYSTLPVQVRTPHCWRLFIKFCFFSGLPIADGEMYYKVLDEVTKNTISHKEHGIDEIILNHEVMEAVNGEQSADILRLPNKKTFRYLQKHYQQQCAKLNEKVFDRRSWEMVMPEV